MVSRMIYFDWLFLCAVTEGSNAVGNVAKVVRINCTATNSDYWKFSVLNCLRVSLTQEN